jgi:hypothetical protein
MTSDSATRPFAFLRQGASLLCAFTLAAAGLSGPFPARADVPFLIGYQGAVFDDQGEPVSGPVEIEANLYDAASGGNVLYRERHADVALIDGAFDFQIGAGDRTDPTSCNSWGCATQPPLTAETFANDEVWLELVVEGESMVPRQRLVAVPYAVRAAVAEQLEDTAVVPYAMRAAVADRVEGGIATSDVYITGAGSQLAGAPLVVENTNATDGVAARFQSQSGLETASFENAGVGEVVKVQGHGTGTGAAALHVENLKNSNSWSALFEGRTRFENPGTGGYGDGRLRAVEVIGNGSWTANPALSVTNLSTNHGIAGKFNNNSEYAATYFGNSGSGAGIYVGNYGATKENATIRADSANANHGMAGYFTNASDYATAQFQNTGTGQVLYLQNNSGTGAGKVDEWPGSSAFIVGVDANGVRRFSIDGSGMAHVRALEILGGADLSERFDVAATPDAPVQPGMVVAIDPENPEGGLVPSRGAYSRTVAGVVAGAGGIAPGLLMAQQGVAGADGEHPVALTGRVYARVDTSNGPIRPGDLLTTSDRTGYAMKATDWQRSQGAVVGKALGSLDEETGLVLVLVGLQ